MTRPAWADRVRALGVVVALVTIPLASRPASAQEALEVAFLDAWARQQYGQGDAQQALRLFLGAHRIAPTPRSTFNIGVVAEVAGERELAYAFFEAYLASGHEDARLVRRARKTVDRLAAAFARIEVRSRPPSAQIFVDRRELGAFGRTPRRIAVGEGQHRLTLALDGFEEQVVSVSARRGKMSVIDVKLEPLTGTLEIETEPTGGDVVVVGPAGARAAKDGDRLELPVGAYRVRFAPAGHQPVQARVILEAGKAERRRLVAPAGPPPESGTLLVNAARPGAEVWIDGLRRAETPARLELVPGRHEIEVRIPGAPYQAEVEVRAGEVLLVRARRERTL